MKYVDPSGHLPEIDDPELNEVLQKESEKEELTYSEDISVDGNSQSTDCPSEFPDCNIFRSGELSTQEIYDWIDSLERHKDRMSIGQILFYVSLVGGLAGVSAFASLAIAGGIVTTTQAVQLISLEISKDVVGTGTMLILDEFFFSEEMGAMDQLINYLTEAAEYSENNGGVVPFRYGNATPNQWGTNVFIQYGTQEPITFSSTVVYLELQYPFVKP